MGSDKLGVIVIGRNEGARLIDCLMSVKSEGMSGRTVYVDSGSSDRSVKAAEELGAVVIRLDLTQPFTAARARNEGFVALRTLNQNARFVQFLDGDCELVSGWLDKALSFIEERNDVAAVCGRRRERYPERSVYNRLCDIEWNSPIGEVFACGGDSFVRVDAFEEINGFNPELMAGEEPEMCARLRQRGWKVWRLDAEMTRHDAAMTQFSQWWRRAVRSGYGYAEGSTLCSQSYVWKREATRAIVWAGLVPALIATSALFYPSTLWLIFIYPLQVLRVALRRGPSNVESWIYALFITLAKFSEFQGIAKFYWHRLRGRKRELIEYKRINDRL
jgi:GT2 family glycosyltransferase